MQLSRIPYRLVIDPLSSLLLELPFVADLTQLTSVITSCAPSQERSPIIASLTPQLHGYVPHHSCLALEN